MPDEPVPAEPELAIRALAQNPRGHCGPRRARAYDGGTILQVENIATREFRKSIRPREARRRPRTPPVGSARTWLCPPRGEPPCIPLGNQHITARHQWY